MMGQKSKLQLYPHQILMDFKNYVTVRPNRKSTIKIYDTSHHI